MHSSSNIYIYLADQGLQLNLNICVGSDFPHFFFDIFLARSPFSVSIFNTETFHFANISQSYIKKKKKDNIKIAAYVGLAK